MKRKSKWKKVAGITLVSLVMLIVIFGFYFGNYYHSIDIEKYLANTEDVKVTTVSEGLLFDGPGEKEALIFYPGAKVETDAYAPLMHQLAENGIDCFLVDMPLHMAIFGVDRAEEVMEEYHYEIWDLGGHSLGGAMAADFTAEHADQVDGLLLLASYPTKDLSKTEIAVTTIYGSEDGVLNMDKLEEGRKLLPKGSKERCIEGGNHAQFGSYGKQKGDGEAQISAEKQLKETVDTFLESR